MRKVLLSLTLAIFAFSLYGCATFNKLGQTNKNFKELRVGMTKGELVDLMGYAEAQEIFVEKDGTKLEVLKYKTGFDIGGPLLDFGIQPVCVEDNEVIGWGWRFYKNKKREMDILYPKE